MKLLFLSNGSGEDAIATLIMGHLTAHKMGAFPLVGAGAAYERFQRQQQQRQQQQRQETITIVGQQKAPPSGGLSNENWRLWLSDFRNGLLVQKALQLRQLRALRAQGPLLVCVGDLLTVAFGRLAGFRRSVFIGTAKSSFHHPYSRPEQWLMNHCCRQIFPRDERTAADLRHVGLPAQWVGNAMMDGLHPEEQLELEPNCFGVAVFPGSREQTYRELPILLDYLIDTAQQLGPSAQLDAWVAVADSIEIDRLALACPGWQPSERGWIHPRLSSPHDRLRVHLVRQDLNRVLRHSQVGLGVAGTAHEQAVGCGVPVIAPHPHGKPLGWYRGRQKGLLGEALIVTPPDGVVPNLLWLLSNGPERRRRAQVGRDRMGPSGGAERMARWISQQI